ncbi:hypothetical protein IQ07DRAFT_222665 [Pyrenochaeta sp. DS3sAY3a]|nr:hypothetical protein IQ07DRAFT_222665 [Pyrenochaeta sp. DS3sAY3a]
MLPRVFVPFARNRTRSISTVANIPSHLPTHSSVKPRSNQTRLRTKHLPRQTFVQTKMYVRNTSHNNHPTQQRPDSQLLYLPPSVPMYNHKCRSIGASVSPALPAPAAVQTNPSRSHQCRRSGTARRRAHSLSHHPSAQAIAPDLSRKTAGQLDAHCSHLIRPLAEGCLLTTAVLCSRLPAAELADGWCCCSWVGGTCRPSWLGACVGKATLHGTAARRMLRCACRRAGREVVCCRWVGSGIYRGDGREG